MQPRVLQTYNSSDQMEDAFPIVQSVMGEHTDATLTFFKTLAERTDRDFESDFSYLVDNILKVSIADLDTRCAMIVSQAVIRV